ncbi:histidine phosphatase family protein [Paenibacillus popilliae]|uniref:Phosphoglycerate mutase n=1 Tax=Paenibacillus popilliae TaxID=78057 RepID=A0ABY3AQ65_PAEPP|nr:histidine phosphatase family protein [Paenibacillus sp. SDF0028]TQR44746.1 phosphoglycerate mutase [Paenibacillus sp. SDF0028]
MTRTTKWNAPVIHRNRRRSGASKNNRKRLLMTRHMLRKKSQASGKIVRFALVRHGLTQENTERRYISYSDVPLLPDSTEELRALRRTLAHPSPLLYTSDMRRCRDTLAYLRPRDSIQAVEDTRLREYDFGMWEGLTYNDLKEDPQYRRWLDDSSAIQPPRGEPWQSFCTRTAHVWWEVLRNARDSFISSGNHMERQEGAIRRRPCHSSPLPRGRVLRSKTSRMQRQSYGSGPTPRPDVVIVTHGGVVRRLYTLAFPRKSFWEAAAPIGGGVMITAKRCARKWKFLRAERLPSR